MKLLRKTIRKILLENKSHYDAVIDLISSEKIDDIEYALQLAEAAELIGVYTHQEETHYDSRSHTWTFHEFDEVFFSALSDKIKEIICFVLVAKVFEQKLGKVASNQTVSLLPSRW